MRRFLLSGICLLALALPAGSLGGCGSRPADGMTPAQQETSNRLQQVAKTSGGDWNRLSPADRAFLLEMAHGNERSARMLLLGASGKLRSRPGGPGRRPR